MKNDRRPITVRRLAVRPSCKGRIEVASRCWRSGPASSSPSARAAACSISRSRSGIARLVGLTSTRDRVASGTSSCSSSSRFGAQLDRSRWLTPVTLPPGRLRLATRPSSTGSPPLCEHDRDGRGRRLGRQRRGDCRRSQRSPPPGGEPDRPPAPAIDRIGPPPSDIRSRRSGLRHSPLRSGPGETRADESHRRRGEPLSRNPITGIAAAARAPRAATPPRRRAA